jgi:hypothetical protein
MIAIGVDDQPAASTLHEVVAVARGGRQQWLRVDGTPHWQQTLQQHLPQRRWVGYRNAVIVVTAQFCAAPSGNQRCSSSQPC